MATISWPWAIVLCKFSDLPAETQPPQYYRELFTENGTGGMCDFRRTVTCGAFDLTGSRVFGWFTMSHASADVHSLTFPGQRSTLVQWGIDAAHANGVDLSPFRTALVVHNYGVDHGWAGNGLVLVHDDPALCEYGFISHEMGHGHGLPHSFAANPDFEYGDSWDVMSFATTTFQFPIAFNGTQGSATVGLNARNLEALGAVPVGRSWSGPGPDFSSQVTLDPLSQPLLGSHGQLIARIPPAATSPARPSGSTFLVEFHRKAGWDEAIPEDSVSVREVRSKGLSYLQPGIWQRLTATQEYVTPSPEAHVRVASIDSVPGTATLGIWDIPNGCLRKEDSKPKVYLIDSGKKRWVTSPTVLFALGKTWADVRSVPDGALTSVPDGPDVVVLSISVSPSPVPVNRSVSVTVSAINVGTGTDVGGQVLVDGTAVGTTGTAFAHIFRTRRIRVPGTVPPEFEITYPTGIVRAAGFPDTPIDLYGNVLVEPADPDYWPPVHREVLLTLDDILLEDGKVAPFSRSETTYSAMGRFGDALLVSGETDLSLTGQLGEVVPLLYDQHREHPCLQGDAARGADERAAGHQHEHSPKHPPSKEPTCTATR